MRYFYFIRRPTDVILFNKAVKLFIRFICQQYSIPSLEQPSEVRLSTYNSDYLCLKKYCFFISPLLSNSLSTANKYLVCQSMFKKSNKVSLSNKVKLIRRKLLEPFHILFFCNSDISYCIVCFQALRQIGRAHV